MSSLFTFTVLLIIFSLTMAWTFLTTPGRIKSKLFAATVLVAVSASFYFTFPSYFGYPTTEELPEESRFVSSVVYPPSSDGDKGAIYFWLIPNPTLRPFWKIFAYDATAREPRAFKIPFSNAGEAAASEANIRLTQGQKVFVKNKKGKKMTGHGDAENPDDYEAPEIVGQDVDLPPKE